MPLTYISKKTGNQKMSMLEAYRRVNDTTGSASTSPSSPISLGDREFRCLSGDHSASNTSAIKLGSLSSGFTLEKGTYFSTEGYIKEFSGGTMGSVSRDILANTSNGGWEWAKSNVTQQLFDLQNTSGSTLFRHRKYVGPGSDNSIDSSSNSYADWVAIQCTGDHAGSTAYSLSRTYASWSTFSTNWSWTRQTYGGAISGTGTDGVKRYITIE